ncbi:hypothetical protein IHE45_20G012500 [Dioscorea alata]|uniref:Uncharacterized protein n=1 Tax=Dioscorea alata TaxID=55571 RepID=A0ACB7TSX1_DIOAL|nr:hypothetical protein IHE45_20G012500 [Dioscorea alata]
MTTGRINQVAPSRATAGGAPPRRAPVAATHRTPGHWDRGVSEGRSGDGAGGRAAAASCVCRGRSGTTERGRRPPRVRSKWASNPRRAAGKPAARRRWAGQPSRAVGERATLPPEGRAARR